MRISIDFKKPISSTVRVTLPSGKIMVVTQELNTPQVIGDSKTESFNLNRMTSVTLTEYGANAHLQWHKNLFRDGWNKHNAEYKTERKAGDTVKMPIWEIMSVFGDSLYNGSPGVPFVNNQITIEKE